VYGTNGLGLWLGEVRLGVRCFTQLKHTACVEERSTALTQALMVGLCDMSPKSDRSFLCVRLMQNNGIIAMTLNAWRPAINPMTVIVSSVIFVQEN